MDHQSTSGLSRERRCVHPAYNLQLMWPPGRCQAFYHSPPFPNLHDTKNAACCVDFTPAPLAPPVPDDSTGFDHLHVESWGWLLGAKPRHASATKSETRLFGPGPLAPRCACAERRRRPLPHARRSPGLAPVRRKPRPPPQKRKEKQKSENEWQTVGVLTCWLQLARREAEGGEDAHRLRSRPQKSRSESSAQHLIRILSKR